MMPQPLPAAEPDTVQLVITHRCILRAAVQGPPESSYRNGHTGEALSRLIRDYLPGLGGEVLTIDVVLPAAGLRDGCAVAESESAARLTPRAVRDWPQA